MMAGLKAVFVGIMCAILVMIIAAVVFHADGAWTFPVAVVIGVAGGYGDLVQSREKAAKRMVKRIEAEERIREQVRRRMRNEP